MVACNVAVNTANAFGETPLHKVARCCRGSPRAHTSLLQAARVGNMDMVRSVVLCVLCGMCDGAARQVDLLLRLGADANVSGREGKPRHVSAARHGTAT